MISVHVCSNVADQPFETFIDLESTTRFVSVPQGVVNGSLSVQSDEPCFLTILRNEEEVFSAPLSEARKSFPLAQLLTPAPASRPRRDAHALLSKVLRPAKLAFSEPEVPAHPTLTAVLRKDGPEGEVLGTYEFVLLPLDEFDRAHADYHRSREPRVPAPQFTNDARSPKDARNCWNCQAPIACGTCNNCGCGQEQGC